MHAFACACACACAHICSPSCTRRFAACSAAISFNYSYFQLQLAFLRAQIRGLLRCNLELVCLRGCLLRHADARAQLHGLELQLLHFCLEGFGFGLGASQLLLDSRPMLTRLFGSLLRSSLITYCRRPPALITNHLLQGASCTHRSSLITHH